MTSNLFDSLSFLMDDKCASRNTFEQYHFVQQVKVICLTYFFHKMLPLRDAVEVLMSKYNCIREKTSENLTEKRI